MDRRRAVVDQRGQRDRAVRGSDIEAATDQQMNLAVCRHRHRALGDRLLGALLHGDRPAHR